MVRTKREIKKIEDAPKRHVAFSKRRSGLFKKANELRHRSGDEIAIITITKAGNVYAFGHPNVDSVVDRYNAHMAARSLFPGGDDEGDSDEDRRSGLDLSLSLKLEEVKDEQKLVGSEEIKVLDRTRSIWDSVSPDLSDLTLEDLALEEINQIEARIREKKKEVVDRIKELSRSGLIG